MSDPNIYRVAGYRHRLSDTVLFNTEHEAKVAWSREVFSRCINKCIDEDGFTINADLIDQVMTDPEMRTALKILIAVGEEIC